MEALVVLAFVVILALLANRFGHDSSPRIRSQEEFLARSGFAVDSETLSVFPETAPATSPPVMQAGGPARSPRLT